MNDATLWLKVLGSGGHPVAYDVVARIERIDIAREDQGPIDVVVPVAADEGLDVTVNAGSYNVQLFLADGRVLQRACDVEAGKRQPVVFHEGESVPTGFSLQASGSTPLADILAKAVGSRRTGTAPTSDARGRGRGSGMATGGRTLQKPLRAMKMLSRAAGKPTSQMVRRGKQATSGNMAVNGRGVGTFRVGAIAHFTVASQVRERIAYTRLIREGRSPSTTLDLSGVDGFDGLESWHRLASDPRAFDPARWGRVSPTHSEGGASIWRLAPDSAGTSDSAERRWGLVSMPKGIEVVSIPGPWHRMDDGNLSAIDVLVDATVGGRAGTSVAVRDEVLDGLLSYLAHGRLASVRPLLAALERNGVIERAIRDKRSNPLAACAAAYVGLAVLEPSEPTRWDSWLPNIMNWFPGIADGAIVHARRVMLRPKDHDETAELMDALERAFAAGVPYYSSGLFLMREMLELLEPEQSRARALLARVAPVASRCDPRQMFTVLRYPEVNG